MKNIKFLLVILAATFIFSCDEVEGPYKLDSNYCEEDSPALPYRKILIEAFTGFGDIA